jgi:phosphoribosylanthranilate isomerase
MTKVKICGLMNRQELDYALAAGSDAVGFVVEIDSSRHCLSAAAAADLIRHVPIYSKSVAVINPRDVDEALRLAHETGAEVLQVHGSLSPIDLAELKGQIHQKIIAAVAGQPGGDEARRYAAVADAVLLDSMAGGTLGGTGMVHDWLVSAEIAASLRVPVILAGGLYPGNVVEAIEKVKPYAVDVSSGTETEGRKDPAKVRSFLQAVRGCPSPQ